MPRRKNNWNFKDPNRKSNKMKLTQTNKWLEKRYEIFDEVKEAGGSDIQALVKALEIVPIIKNTNGRRKK